MNFAVSSANELTVNTNRGKLTVMVTTTSTATNVTVNGTNALRYNDATFSATNMQLTTSYTATAAASYGRHSTNTVNVSIATNTTYQFDGNGNLTNDGLRSFAYDNENQLLQVWVTNQWLSQFAYDGKMRRRMRQEYTWQNSGWVQTNQVYYLYDGNVVIQKRNINNLPTTTDTGGLDLSSTLQGAGGIGGLLAMTLNTASGPAASNSIYYHSDGNGNVTMLINPWQYIVAKYLYAAFGNTLSAAGTLAQQNLYRFSSKEAHPNSGLVYYLYRYCDPNLQRWLNRDPIEEKGGLNLYALAMNQTVNSVDFFGLKMSPGDCQRLERKWRKAEEAAQAAADTGAWNAQILEDEAQRLHNSWIRYCEDPPGPGTPWWCPVFRPWPVIPDNPSLNLTGFCSNHVMWCIAGASSVVIVSCAALGPFCLGFLAF